MLEYLITPKAIHICNSHEPTLKPKISKELVFLPILFLSTLKNKIRSVLN